MMKNRCFFLGLFILIVFVLTLGADRVFEFEETFRSPRVMIDEDRLFVEDDASYLIHVYGRKRKTRLFVFGQRGEGPGEFKSRPRLCFVNDQLCISSSGKLSFFDYEGLFLRDVRTGPSVYRARPVGQNYVGRKLFSPDDKNMMKVQWNIYSIANGGEQVATLIEHFDRVGNGPQGNKPVWLFAEPTVVVVTWKDKVIVGDPREKFLVRIYGENGDLERTIDHPYEETRLSKNDRERLLEENARRFGQTRTRRHREIFTYVFPEVFPPFMSLTAADRKIYVYTYIVNRNRRQVLVFDFNGSFLRESNIIADKTGTIFGNRHFFLVENDVSEKWELHVEDL